MSLALAGRTSLAARFARNGRFSAIGNATGAALMGAVGYYLSSRSVFFLAAALSFPAIALAWPLRAADARALIKFLVDAFGFEETVVYGEGSQVDHAQLSWPLGGGIMLGSARPDADGDDWPLKPGSFGGYVVTNDPDALFARATGAGAKVLMELHDTDYGSRDFAVTDPEGNRWSFGTYRGEPRKAS
jgi:uncharacterized glyoxalase superfamily protein PhnB